VKVEISTVPEYIVFISIEVRLAASAVNFSEKGGYSKLSIKNVPLGQHIHTVRTVHQPASTINKVQPVFWRELRFCRERADIFKIEYDKYYLSFERTLLLGVLYIITADPRRPGFLFISRFQVPDADADRESS
jgi:hypothetical protein